MDDARRRAAFQQARTRDDDRPDIEYYRERAERADGPALELACGTGRVYLRLLAAGLDVAGFDIEPAYLDALRRRAAEEGLAPTVWQADMTAFAVDRPYGLVYCPFNAMHFLRTAEDRLAALDAVYDALAPGGSFVFDVFVPSFDRIAETYGEWQTETVAFRGERCEYRHRTTISDEPRQWFEVEYDARDADGEVLFAGVNEQAMLPHSTGELLARCSPFEEWTVTGDFSGEPLGDGHTLQVWELQK